MAQVLLMTSFWHAIAALLLAALVVMGSPGPATISVMALGAAFGFCRSVRYLTGIILGTITVLMVVAFGILSLLTSLPHVAPILLTASSLYMLYPACRIAMAPPLAAQTRQTRSATFLSGFLLGVANPKAYLAIGAVFAESLLPIESPLVAAFIKVGLLSGMIVVIHVIWLLVGVSLAEWLRHPVISRTINLFFAGILVLVTVLPMLRLL